MGLRELLRFPAGVDARELWFGMEHSNFLVQRGRMDPEHWLKRAVLLYSLRRFEEALQCLRLVLAAEPRHAEAHFLRGVCWQLLALERAPRLAEPDRAARDLLERARDAFRRAARLAPGDEEARACIATLEALLGTRAETAETPEAPAVSQGQP